MSARNTGIENLKADVVVIGAGGSGLCAAVQATENGAKVIVVEKQRNTGGNTATAHEFFAADSQVQKRLNIDAPKDFFFKYAMDWHHWRVNPRIVRTFINKTAETSKWLEDKGLQIPDVSAPGGPSAFRVGHRATGASIVKVLMKSCENLGIQILCGTPAREILTGPGGKVTGVVASSREKTYRISAKSVVITSGGYGANKSLMKKYFPDYSPEGVSYVGVPGLTGDGYKMATGVGAATDGINLFHIGGPRFSGMRLVGAINRRPEPVWVNKLGQRYCDECVVFDLGTRGNAIDRQPGKISYTIVDDHMKEHFIQENAATGGGPSFTTPPGTNWNDMDKELKIEADRGIVKIAKTWDEMAKWMGVPPAVLKNTIEEYNEACEKQYDNLFLKDPKYLKPLRKPPFYALKCNLGLMDTMGGIKVNENMEVLDKQGQPIAGLYAGGVCVGGFESETYCYRLTGSMLSFSLNSGRIAGENATRHAIRK